MKAVCTQENLSKALSYLERATGKQSTLPILSNFLLIGENGKLKLSATNLEIGVTSLLSAKLDGNGEIAVPVKILSNFVNNIAVGELITLSLDGNTLSLESTGHSLRVRGLDPKDFPIIPEKKGAYILTLPAQTLKTAISKLIPCVSASESRIELTGMNFIFLEKEIHIAATDSFRLAEYILPLSKEQQAILAYSDFIRDTSSLIIPQMAVQELFRMITPETKDVFVAFEENQVFFESDGVSLVSRIINGKYPDYKQILPKNFCFSVTIKKEEFLRAVRMASMFSSQMNGEMLVKLVSHSQELSISSQASDIGENKTILKGEVSGDGELEMRFNPKYVLDGLAVVESDLVVFSANSSSTPVAFIGTDQNLTYIAMPIRK